MGHLDQELDYPRRTTEGWHYSEEIDHENLESMVSKLDSDATPMNYFDRQGNWHQNSWITDIKIFQYKIGNKNMLGMWETHVQQACR
jgi:cell division FtsZ-interacting protein ZapD